MDDLTEKVEVEEQKEINSDEYEKEYDRLWNEANNINEEPTEANEHNETFENVEENDTGSNKDIQNEEEANNTTEQSLKKQEEAIDNDESMSEQEKNEAKAFLKIKARGTELDLTEDEAKELASKGIDYTLKTQEIAKWKRLIENAKDIPENDLNAIKALRNGNKDALLQLAKEYNIDLYDLDTEKEPEVPNYLNQSNQPNVEELQRISQRIEADKDTLPKVEQVLDVLPNEFKEQMVANPNLLEGLYVDIKQGITDTILNEALKSYYVSGGNFLNHYQNAYQKMYNQQTLEPQQVQQVQKAVPPKINTQSKKKDYLQDAEEIWNMPKDDFAKLKAKVMAKSIL